MRFITSLSFLFFGFVFVFYFFVCLFPFFFHYLLFFYISIFIYYFLFSMHLLFVHNLFSCTIFCYLSNYIWSICKEKFVDKNSLCLLSDPISLWNELLFKLMLPTSYTFSGQMAFEKKIFKKILFPFCPFLNKP